MKNSDLKILSQKMNMILADIYALYLKTQNYHWNITGPMFFSLHSLFETQYKEQAEAIDELAEKIRSNGIKVQADFEYFAKNSTIISNLNNSLSDKEMLKDLAESHQIIIEKFYDLSEQAASIGNKSIDDFATQRIVSHEKQRWMIISCM
ncbi:MAG: DNA starvation/stationary phase protection protein [Rickettsiaceae bacterium]|nr:DNA starvation/stationary phase protection protein [Rickettsiaceae bacterium]